LAQAPRGSKTGLVLPVLTLGAMLDRAALGHLPEGHFLLCLEGSGQVLARNIKTKRK